MRISRRNLSSVALGPKYRKAATVAFGQKYSKAEIQESQTLKNKALISKITEIGSQIHGEGHLPCACNTMNEAISIISGVQNLHHYTGNFCI